MKYTTIILLTIAIALSVGVVIENVGVNPFFIAIVVAPLIVPTVCSALKLYGGLESDLIAQVGVVVAFITVPIYYYFAYFKVPDKYDGIIYFFVPSVQVMLLIALVAITKIIKIYITRCSCTKNNLREYKNRKK